MADLPIPMPEPEPGREPSPVPAPSPVPSPVPLDRLYAAATAAAHFYASALRGSRTAAHYLQAHGIATHGNTACGNTACGNTACGNTACGTAGPWLLGYAPPRWTALADHLRGAGFTSREIVTAGLCFAHRASGHLLDRFRDRLMFPVTDRDNRVIAFTARDLSGRTDAVWLNSPETPLYRKSHILYGLGQQLAHRPHGTGDPIAFLVEGAADVLAVHRMAGPTAVPPSPVHRATSGTAVPPVHPAGAAGTATAPARDDTSARTGAGPMPYMPPIYAVAPCGTHLTMGQLDLLWRALPGAHLVLTFDSDDAGRAATTRAYPMAATWQGRLSGARLPAGTDPAELLAAAGLTRALAALTGSIVPLAQVQLGNTITRLFDTGRITNPVAFAEDRIVAYRAIADLFLDAPHASRAMALTAAELLGLPVTDITRGVVEAWEAVATATRSARRPRRGAGRSIRPGSTVPVRPPDAQRQAA